MTKRFIEVIQSNMLASKYMKEGDKFKLKDGNTVRVTQNRTTKCWLECYFNKHNECYCTAPRSVLKIIPNYFIYLMDKNRECFLSTKYHFELENEKRDKTIIKIKKLLKDFNDEQKKFIIKEVTNEKKSSKIK